MMRFAPVNAVAGWIGLRLAGAHAIVLWAGIVAALALGATSVLVSYATSRQGVVARVNGEPITQRELQRRLVDPAVQRQAQQRDVKRILASATGSRTPAEAPAKAAKELEGLALRKLIYVRLVVQEAGRRHIKVTDQELEQFAAAVKRRFKDDASYAVWRRTNDLQDDRALIEALRTDALVSRVSAALVAEARPSDAQLQAYYERHKALLKIPEAARLQIITLQDKAAAEQVLKALKKGADFARLARERSKGARAAEGGDFGWIAIATLPAGLQRTVAGLKVGETGGPVQSGTGFVVVRVLDRRAERTKSLDEAKRDIEQRLLRAKQGDIVMAWLAAQEKSSKIEIYR